MTTTLITGGAGFIGTNLAHRILSEGERVIVLDNLSRRHVLENAQWLRHLHGKLFELRVGDVRDPGAVRCAMQDATTVFHLAAQGAVSRSLVSPTEDFQVNAAGTLNVLEAVRAMDRPPFLLFTSTHKVYGSLSDVALRPEGKRYEPVSSELRACGISESRALDFLSPYGCSKGTADQYVLDYGRCFGLSTTVFRMSCIYGPRQLGSEDQGWVAHFLLRTLQGEPLTFYGDGMQVRDVLFVGDLVDAMRIAQRRVDLVRGRAFNIGGGPENTTSLLELLDAIEQLCGRRPRYSFDEWRTGDQRYYTSDCRAFRELTGWTPRIRPHDGLRRLHRWLRESMRSSLPRTSSLRELER